MAIEDIVRAFVDAYSAGDHARTRDLVDDAIDARITAPDGGVDHARAPRGFLARFPDLSDAQLTLTVAQAVAVEPCVLA